MIEIVGLDGSAFVQDLGRPGYSHLGVSPSGAADRWAHCESNRALGQGPECATLEVIGQVQLQAVRDSVVAYAGAASGLVRMAAGDRLTLSKPRFGLRTYLAVPGGVQVVPVLGSRSTDVLSGLGPAPLGVGDVVVAGSAGAAEVQMPDWRAYSGLIMLDAAPGPRADWVQDLGELFRRPWRVSPLADRVGTRLIGEPLKRAVTIELASEGVVTGSVQLPPSGEPVILGPDHPVTGGYPVIAVLTGAASGALAQAPTGTTVRFRRAR